MKLYKFCPKCGEKLDKVIEKNQVRLKCANCKFIFYQNSKPTVCAIILKGDMVLFGKRAINPAKGKWDLPGGFLEEGEHPEKGLMREVLEETGLKVKPISVVGFFMDKYGSDGGHTLNISYTTKIISGKMRAGDDVAEGLKWFKISNLPKNTAFKNTRDILKKLKALYRSRKL